MREIPLLFGSVALWAATAAAQIQPSGQLVVVDRGLPASDAVLAAAPSFLLHSFGDKSVLVLPEDVIHSLRASGSNVTILGAASDVGDIRLLTSKNGRFPASVPPGLHLLFMHPDGWIVRGEAEDPEELLRAGLKTSHTRLRPFRAEPPDLHSLASPHAADSAIAAVVARVNQDTVRYFIQSLQNFGTRYWGAANRDTVARWIMGEFLRFGLTDVRLDSFFYGGTWQTNVVARLPGHSPDSPVIITGAHHDSYSSVLTAAPGADDNASGTAAVLETARILMLSGFRPEATITFMTFAAEETGLIGSRAYATRAAQQNERIRLMINHDMIANSSLPVPGSPVDVYYYTGAEPYRDLAKTAVSTYTPLAPQTGGTNSGGSDSYSFWAAGFPAVYFFEHTFSPYYHSPQDVISSCNIAYCAEVIRGSAALLLTVNAMPSPIGPLAVIDRGDGTSLRASWTGVDDPDLAAYRIRVGRSAGAWDTTFSLLDTSVVIARLVEGTAYTVSVAAVDADGNEGFSRQAVATPRSVPLVPGQVTATPDRAVITLRWRRQSEADLLGFHVYRSDSGNSSGVRITPTSIRDTSFVDVDAPRDRYQFYSVTAVDSALNESFHSPPVRSHIVTLAPGILLVDETAESPATTGTVTDAEMDAYYSSLVAGRDVSPYDLLQEGGIGIADLGRRSVVVWLADENLEWTAAAAARDHLKAYLLYGGKVLYAGYRPSRFLSGQTGTAMTFVPGDFPFDFAKLRGSTLGLFTLFSGATVAGPGYPPVHVDSSRARASDSYHLRTVEALTPNDDGATIYRFDSFYSSSSSQGAMKGLPVGTEYIGADHSIVLLSFPLYYVKPGEAKALLDHVLDDRFSQGTSAVEPDHEAVPAAFALHQNYPNPFNPVTVIGYELPEASDVRLVVYDLLGREVRVLEDGAREPGPHTVAFDARALSSGVYIYRLTAGGFTASARMMLLR